MKSILRKNYRQEKEDQGRNDTKRYKLVVCEKSRKREKDLQDLPNSKKPYTTKIENDEEIKQGVKSSGEWW